MSKYHTVIDIKRRSLIATTRAKRRWEMDSKRRDLLAEMDPIKVGGKIVERVIVIRDESRVRERVFYEHDRECDWKRKRRELQSKW